MANLDIWFRPWALFDVTGAAYIVVSPGESVIDVTVDCAPLIITDHLAGPQIDGKRDVCEKVGKIDSSRTAWLIPSPLRASAGFILEVPGHKVRVNLTRLPDASLSEVDPDGASTPSEADVLMHRVKCVWARLKDVEDVLADPARMWTDLANLWLSDNAADRPRMDKIVEQARKLPSIIERLDKRPRRILRRIHKQVPLSRVQEFDRLSMTWLIRQPGDTIAEQAGDRQSIMAVAREENFNTLENRVLLAYSRLAKRIAADYAPTNTKRALKRRDFLVRTFGKRCRNLATDLVERGVLEARPDVTANFVLLNNSDYNQIWTAWHVLLNRRRIFDELWRWQARSWAEFSALAIMVALHTIDGARQVATSPVVFRDEQLRGCWVEHINPIGVVFLEHERFVVEVRYEPGGDAIDGFCAPLRISYGRVEDEKSFLRRILVWPVWSNKEITASELLDELQIAFPVSSNRSVLRQTDSFLALAPSGSGERTAILKNKACVALGTSDHSLREGVLALAETIKELIRTGGRV